MRRCGPGHSAALIVDLLALMWLRTAADAAPAARPWRISMRPESTRHIRDWRFLEEHN
jgi:hypothetical protein